MVSGLKPDISEPSSRSKPVPYIHFRTNTPDKGMDLSLLTAARCKTVLDSLALVDNQSLRRKTVISKLVCHRLAKPFRKN